MSPISALKILLLVNSFMQISVDVNEPFAIECCTTTQTNDDKYAVCGTNFSPNQLLCRKYLATFLLYGGDF